MCVCMCVTKRKEGGEGGYEISEWGVCLGRLGRGVRRKQRREGNLNGIFQTGDS